MSKMRVQQVEEVSYGLYLWEMPNGSLVANEDGDFLNVAAMKGDVRKINALRQAAKFYGIEEGKPKWFSGHRQVTQEEFEEQRSRMDLGLVPDELDVPAIKEDLIEKKKMGLYK
jgi:hypothetical protein